MIFIIEKTNRERKQFQFQLNRQKILQLADDLKAPSTLCVSHILLFIPILRTFCKILKVFN